MQARPGERARLRRGRPRTASTRSLGARGDFEALAETLHARGMGVIVDIVPNHMGVMGADNAWWLDVLENGPASKFAKYFDIDWQPARRELAGRVLLPVLGDHYGVGARRPASCAWRSTPTAARFAVHYHEHRLPAGPRHLAAPAAACGASGSEATLGAHDPTGPAELHAGGVPRSLALPPRWTEAEHRSAPRAERAARGRPRAPRADRARRVPRSAPISTPSAPSSTASPASRRASSRCTRCSRPRPGARRTGA
ncbi:MAG: alpha-amylase family glycosyl hydrolase [Halofilum sp. (in: g-proteobacteria)]|nr:alpha-amylase family glycosyl hydrolase [Halofilum sp. (in: g-proteobacteria)]